MFLYIEKTCRKIGLFLKNFENFLKKIVQNPDFHLTFFCKPVYSNRYVPVGGFWPSGPYLPFSGFLKSVLQIPACRSEQIFSLDVKGSFKDFLKAAH